MNRNRIMIVLFIILLFLTGCEKAMQDMYDQPKYKPLAASEFFADGQSSRPRVAGTVVYSGGSLAESASGRVGRLSVPEPSSPVYPVVAGETVREGSYTGLENPLLYTLDVLARGRERFNIYCAPCHSEAGDGDGTIVRRGFPQPPTYHSERLRAVSDDYIYRVISQGYGVMFSYADRVPPDDRWAIVAYIRALQLSQHAPLADLAAAERRRLQETP